MTSSVCFSYGRSYHVIGRGYTLTSEYALILDVTAHAHMLIINFRKKTQWPDDSFKLNCLEL